MSVSARITDVVRAALTPSNAKVLEPPVLLDAALVLELAGESLRSRLVFSTTREGLELCLRPDLTVPAAIAVLEREAETGPSVGPSAFVCDGLVFRAAKNDELRPPEFRQIGLERFDDQDSVAADTDIVMRACTALTEAGVKNATIRFGDGGLMAALIGALHVPEPWRARLESAVHTPELLKSRITHAVAPASTPPPLASALAAIDLVAAEAAVSEILALSQAPIIGGRNAATIAARLRDQAQQASAKPLDAALGAALTEAITVSGDPRRALDALQALALRVGSTLEGFIHGWHQRLDALKARTVNARFDASYVGSFDYYDGLLFRIEHEACAEGPLAAGGRYDQLLGRLSGGARQGRAVGCVVRPDRVALAARAST